VLGLQVEQLDALQTIACANLGKLAPESGVAHPARRKNPLVDTLEQTRLTVAMAWIVQVALPKLSNRLGRPFQALQKPVIAMVKDAAALIVRINARRRVHDSGNFQLDSTRIGPIREMGATDNHHP